VVRSCLETHSHISISGAYYRHQHRTLERYGHLGRLEETSASHPTLKSLLQLLRTRVDDHHNHISHHHSNSKSDNSNHSPEPLPTTCSTLVLVQHQSLTTPHPSRRTSPVVPKIRCLVTPVLPLVQHLRGITTGIASNSKPLGSATATHRTPLSGYLTVLASPTLAISYTFTQAAYVGRNLQPAKNIRPQLTLDWIISPQILVKLET